MMESLTANTNPNLDPSPNLDPNPNPNPNPDPNPTPNPNPNPSPNPNPNLNPNPNPNPIPNQESLTATLVEEAEAIVTEVEAMGGMAQAVATGMPKRRIEEAATRKQAP